MPDRPYNLAVETTVRIGSVTLGRGDEMIATVELPDPHKPPRRAVDLMPTIDAVMREHGAARGQLGEMYLSIGPGSFTGLRIAVATGKMLARVLGVKLVAVPTLDVVAQVGAVEPAAASLVAWFRLSQTTQYGAVYEPVGDAWVRRGEARLAPLDELIAEADRPTVLVMDPSLPAPQADEGAAWRIVPPRAGSQAVWRLGRAAATRAAYTDPAHLLPLYVRPPEAVEIWNKRHGAAEQQSSRAAEQQTR